MSLPAFVYGLLRGVREGAIHQAIIFILYAFQYLLPSTASKVIRRQHHIFGVTLRRHGHFLPERLPSRTRPVRSCHSEE